jgi:hypothetical protein
MNQRTPHTEPTTNSHAAAYGYKYRYDGFADSAQASHGLSPRHTVTEPDSSAWITDANGNVNQHLQYLAFGGLPPSSAIPLGVGSKENLAQFFKLLGFCILKLTKAELLTL